MLRRTRLCQLFLALSSVLVSAASGQLKHQPNTFEIVDPMRSSRQRTVALASANALPVQAEPAIEATLTETAVTDAATDQAAPSNAESIADTPAAESTDAENDTAPAAGIPSHTKCNGHCQCQRQRAQKAKENAAALKKAAAGSHKVLHYLNDFSYLNDPNYDGRLLGDGLKEFHVGRCFDFDFGGQYRLRLHSEENMRGLGLTGLSDDFNLHRTRLYMNAKIGKRVRFFGETLDAYSNGETFAPRPIEENRWEMQNMFFDVNVLDTGKANLVGRFGRQEIALGDQRYVSPLDWANTRRTFDGGRAIFTRGDWTVDSFYLRPMIRRLNRVDKTNDDVHLYGMYFTRDNTLNGLMDLYWIAFDNDIAGFAFDSLGARYKGSFGELLIDTEAAYQFGRNADGTDHDAGFFTVGAGKALSNLPFQPTTWAYCDWASGANQNGAGNGHHHFQPLAHKYNGFMDLYGRRNLIDVNWLTILNMTDKNRLLFWFHSFWLEDSDDTPYNVNMTPFAPGIVGIDDHLGIEWDVIWTHQISPRSNLLFGYSRFWAGDYYDTPGLPFNGDASFFYSQWTVNF